VKNGKVKKKKRKDAELELIHSNDSVVYNIPRATPREGAALTPVKAEKTNIKKADP